MIHSLLPIFLVTVLGVSTLSVGIIEGIAEATASITKVFAGAISDWTGRRKPLVLIGYGMAALTKPLFPLAQGVAVVLLARFVDRMGKGIRGAPRDALVADLTPKGQRGAAYGLRQAMDTVGAFAGPGLALIMMMLTGEFPSLLSFPPSRCDPVRCTPEPSKSRCSALPDPPSGNAIDAAYWAWWSSPRS